MIETYNIDNMTFKSNDYYDVIFADYIYENLDFGWVDKFWTYLKPGGVFIAMTDFHSEHRYRVYLEDEIKAKFINHLVWKNEWGRGPSKMFHQCFDDILLYTNSENYIFNRDKIQVPKVTMTKGLNPSGRTTKTATAWIEDICLTTTAKERVIRDDGHLQKWQKPIRLYDRVVLPFLPNNGTVLDVFGGTFSLGKWCLKNGYDYTGIEYDEESYGLGLKNIYS